MSVRTQLEPSFFLVGADRPTFGDDDARDFALAIKEQREPRPCLILDLSPCHSVKESALRMLTLAIGPALQRDTRIALICQAEPARMVREQGLDSVLPCYSSVTEFLGRSIASSQRQKMLEMLETLVSSAAHMIGASATLEVKANRPYFRGKGPDPLSDTAAVIGLVGNYFSGALVMGYTKKTYLGIMSRMLMMELTDFGPDTKDGAAELLNITFGHAKIPLNERGFGIKLAIPTMIHGRAEIIPAGAGPSLITQFNTPVGDFYMELLTSPISSSPEVK